MSAYSVLRNSTLASTSIYSPPRRQYQQIVQDYNPSLKALWTYMNPTGVPCFNSDMLEELHHSVHQLEQHTQPQTYSKTLIILPIWLYDDHQTKSAKRQY